MEFIETAVEVIMAIETSVILVLKLREMGDRSMNRRRLDTSETSLVIRHFTKASCEMHPGEQLLFMGILLSGWCMELKSSFIVATNITAGREHWHWGRRWAASLPSNHFCILLFCIYLSVKNAGGSDPWSFSTNKQGLDKIVAIHFSPWRRFYTRVKSDRIYWRRWEIERMVMQEDDT